jgi:hypothetical protein
MEKMLQYWTIEDDTSAYHKRGVALRRFIAIMRAWDVQIHRGNLDKQLHRLGKVPYVAAESKTQNKGKFLQCLRQFIEGGGGHAIQRDDAACKSELDPFKRFVLQISSLKVNIGPASAKKLWYECNVRSLAEIVEKRHELQSMANVKGIDPISCRWLRYHYRESKRLMARPERDALLHVVVEEATRIGLRCIVTGGARRNTAASHDVDILLAPDPSRKPYRGWRPSKCAMKGCGRRPCVQVVVAVGGEAAVERAGSSSADAPVRRTEIYCSEHMRPPCARSSSIEYIDNSGEDTVDGPPVDPDQIFNVHYRHGGGNGGGNGGGRGRAEDEGRALLDVLIDRLHVRRILDEAKTETKSTLSLEDLAPSSSSPSSSPPSSPPPPAFFSASAQSGYEDGEEARRQREEIYYDIYGGGSGGGPPNSGANSGANSGVQFFVEDMRTSSFKGVGGSAPEHDVRHCLVRSPWLVSWERTHGTPRRRRQEQEREGGEGAGQEAIAAADRGGVLRRLDLVMAPACQWSFVLWGWTGSQMFERSMRDYVKHAHERSWAHTEGRPIIGRRGWRASQSSHDGRITVHREEGFVYERKLDIAAGEHWLLSQVPFLRAILFALRTSTSSSISISSSSNSSSSTSLVPSFQCFFEALTLFFCLSQNGLKIMRGSNISSMHFDKDRHNDRMAVYVEDTTVFCSEKDIFDFVHIDYLGPDARCA